MTEKAKKMEAPMPTEAEQKAEDFQRRKAARVALHKANCLAENGFELSDAEAEKAARIELGQNADLQTCNRKMREAELAISLETETKQAKVIAESIAGVLGQKASGGK